MQRRLDAKILLCRITFIVFYMSGHCDVLQNLTSLKVRFIPQPYESSPTSFRRAQRQLSHLILVHPMRFHTYSVSSVSLVNMSQDPRSLLQQVSLDYLVGNYPTIDLCARQRKHPKPPAEASRSLGAEQRNGNERQNSSRRLQMPFACKS